MIIPLGDDDARRHTFPIVNLLLITVNVVGFLYVYYVVDQLPGRLEPGVQRSDGVVQRGPAGV